MYRSHDALRAAGFALSLALFALGCERPALPEASIVYVGSSTIGDRVIPEAARAFTEKTGVIVRVGETGGSGLGIQAILAGEADLAGAARALTLDEKQLRLEYTIIGYDSIGVFVHPSNPVERLNEEQLRGLFTGEIVNWKDVGGLDAPVACITQVWGAKRAQMIEFHERILRGKPFREDRTECDRQSDEVRTLLGEPNGISVLSAAYAKSGVKSLALDGVVPDRHGMKLGGFSLSRPLLIVTPAEPRSVVKDFVRLLLSPEGQSIVARRFLPVRPERSSVRL